MDQVSAFAAYKNAQSNQNSKKKQKKPNSNTNSRPVIVLPTHTKKAKVSKFLVKITEIFNKEEKEQMI